jgi:radical SAM-linked protein
LAVHRPPAGTYPPAFEVPGPDQECPRGDRRRGGKITGTRFPATFGSQGKHDEPMVRTKARIRFRKEGDLRLIGHRDLLRAWERLLRRAQVGLEQSGGFHPRPRINFPSALAVGIAGTDEVLELELDREWTSDELQAALAPHALPGLALKAVEILPPASRPAQVGSVVYEIPVPDSRRPRLAARLTELLAQASHPLPRAAGQPPLDMRGLIEELALVEGRLRIRMRVTPQGSVKPREMLAALELEDLPQQGVYWTRTAVELKP